MKTKHTKVVIAGNGIAGLTMSLMLQQAGIAHKVLARRQAVHKPALAETLPPSALPLLQRMGLLPLFAHYSKKTFGYHSLWGTPEVRDINFFMHRPYNYGLKLNKQKLLDHLQQEASSHLVPCDSLSTITPTESGVEIVYHDGAQKYKISSDLMVDATGRNRAALKKMGIGSNVYDHQVALSCHVPRVRHPRIKHSVYTEAFEGGWGIVSALDEGTNVITLFTEKGSPLLRMMKQYDNWPSLLSSTRYLGAFLAPEPLSQLYGYEANSSKAHKLTGPRHIAIGDAAIAFDPLSSHGISNVLFTVETATEAIRHYINAPEEPKPLLAYASTLEKIFQQYLQHRAGLQAVVA